MTMECYWDAEHTSYVNMEMSQKIKELEQYKSFSKFIFAKEPLFLSFFQNDCE